jgi:hypothetical protein
MSVTARQCSFVIIASLLLSSCKASSTVKEDVYFQKEARDRAGSITEKSTSDDVALSEDDRKRFYSRVATDTGDEHMNTMLLIGIASRNSDEKALLKKQIPYWFASSNLETRYMAFLMVDYLKIPGYAQEAFSLLSDFKRKLEISPVDEMNIKQIDTYINKKW